MSCILSRFSLGFFCSGMNLSRNAVIGLRTLLSLYWFSLQGLAGVIVLTISAKETLQNYMLLTNYALGVLSGDKARNQQCQLHSCHNTIEQLFLF